MRKRDQRNVEKRAIEIIPNILNNNIYYVLFSVKDASKTREIFVENEYTACCMVHIQMHLIFSEITDMKME